MNKLQTKSITHSANNEDLIQEIVQRVFGTLFMLNAVCKQTYSKTIFELNPDQFQVITDKMSKLTAEQINNL